MTPNDLFLSSSPKDDLARAAKGDISSTIRAGYRYLTGLAGGIDREKARACLRPVANASPAVPALLAYIDAVDRKIQSDSTLKADAMQTLKRAADAGEPVAQTLLGRLYERKGGGTMLQVAAARELYVAAAPRFALAATYLARMHMGARQREDAIALLEPAAAVGETYGMVDLAFLHIRDRREMTRVVKAKRLLRSAAELGDPRASYQLAVQYYRDGLKGVLGAHGRAFRLFGLAASTGYPPAEAAVGLCFLNGIAVPKDSQRAEYWCGRSRACVARVSATLGLQAYG